ncbi:MAG: hypothetical protein KF734_09545 [Saprospiraceae bacterium]|nr:hypothetical protein [Saprospiraceae bacterium]
MPLTYTNRRREAHYFRAVETAKGGTRYYIVKSLEYPDLIDELPDGFEIREQPYEGRVVLRKKVPVFTTAAERDLVERAVLELSSLNDIMVTAEKETITVWNSQFNYIGGQGKNLTAEEAEEKWGERIYMWKKYDDNFRFILIDPQKRIFQAERRTYFSLGGGDYWPLKNGRGTLEELTERFGPHIGRDSYFELLVPEGFDE